MENQSQAYEKINKFMGLQTSNQLRKVCSLLGKYHLDH